MTDPIRVEGLKDLRSDIRKMQPDLLAEMRGVLKDSAEIVKTRGAALAPRGRRPIPPSRKPHVRLADSLRAGTSGNAAIVRSRALYGPKIERQTEFLSRALEATEDEVVDSIADGIDRLAVRHGWH